MPFWLYSHYLFCSYVHLFLAVRLSLHLGTSRSVIHPYRACRSGPPGCIPALLPILVITPAFLLTVQCFHLASAFGLPLLPINTTKSSSVTASPPISFCLQRIAITQVVDDAGPLLLRSAFLIALGNDVSPRSFWRSQSAGGCSGLIQQTYPSMPFLWAIWPFPSELSQ